MKSQDESARWRQLLERLLAEGSGSAVRALVLAAHPDDETIGASWVLSRAAHCCVVFLTDGAPHDRKLWPPEFRGSREEYANLRREEVRRVLTLAGKDVQSRWLGATDQETALDLPRRLVEFAAILHEFQPDVVITHPYEGGHPDHDSCAFLARMGIEMTGTAAELVEMTSYHAREGSCVTGEFLRSSERLELRVPLTGDGRLRKLNMMSAYTSQKAVLGAFSADEERYRVAPTYDFSHAPHEGKLWYECMGWRLTGRDWRALVQDAMARIEGLRCA